MSNNIQLQNCNVQHPPTNISCSRTSIKTVPLDRKKNTYFTPNPHFAQDYLKNLFNDTLLYESTHNEHLKSKKRNNRFCDKLGQLYERLSYIENALLTGFTKENLPRTLNASENGKTDSFIEILSDALHLATNSESESESRDESNERSFANSTVLVVQNCAIDKRKKREDTEEDVENVFQAIMSPILRNTSFPYDQTASAQSQSHSMCGFDLKIASEQTNSRMIQKNPEILINRMNNYSKAIRSKELNANTSKGRTNEKKVVINSPAPSSKSDFLVCQRCKKPKRGSADNPSPNTSGTSFTTDSSLGSHPVLCECCGKYKKIPRSNINEMSTKEKCYVKDATANMNYECVSQSLKENLDQVLEKLFNAGSANGHLPEEKEPSQVYASRASPTTVDIMEKTPLHVCLADPLVEKVCEEMEQRVREEDVEEVIKVHEEESFAGSVKEEKRKSRRGLFRFKNFKIPSSNHFVLSRKQLKKIPKDEEDAEIGAPRFRRKLGVDSKNSSMQTDDLFFEQMFESGNCLQEAFRTQWK